MVQWRHMLSIILVYIDLSNGLLPGGIKPLSEPMLVILCGIHLRAVQQEIIQISATECVSKAYDQN